MEAAFRKKHPKWLTWEGRAGEWLALCWKAASAGEEIPDLGPMWEDMEARDRRRWQLADANKDDKLDRDEFSGFLHPETEQRMGEIVVTELMEDMDSDRAGLEKTINIKCNKTILLLWLGKYG